MNRFEQYKKIKSKVLDIYLLQNINFEEKGGVEHTSVLFCKKLENTTD